MSNSICEVRIKTIFIFTYKASLRTTTTKATKRSKMTDLTVLVSPIPLYPPNNSMFSLGSSQRHHRPIMVTLETTIDETLTRAEADTNPGHDYTQSSQNLVKTIVDPAFLSPPVNTFKARPRHRPTRSWSAPPEGREYSKQNRRREEEEEEQYKFLCSERRASTPPPSRSINFGSTTNLGRVVSGEPVRPPPPLCMFFIPFHSGFTN